MLERRGFLTAAGTVAGAAALAGCTRGQDERAASAPSRRPQGTATGPADWAGLEKGLAGRLIRPGDAGYNAAHRLYIPRFDRIRPAGIAYCAEPQDVSECLYFARRQRLPVAVRCGGHSYAGWSTGTGLVIDVSPMDSVKASGGRATVGAGARLIDVYAELAAVGVSVPAGTCPTVGIAGLALGGGLGVVGRRYGLTCDAMEAVRVVTADGQILDCDTGRNPDLFWACRGGGGGNFGVAVDFTFRTHETSELNTFLMRWPWSSAGQAIRAWQAWAPSAPDEIWSGLHLNSEPSGTPTIELTGVSFGDPGPELDRLVARTGAAPLTRSVQSRTYLDAMKAMGGCADDSTAGCHLPGKLPGQSPAGEFPRTDYAAKSHVALRPLTDSAIATLTGRFTNGNDVNGRSVLLDALGGAIARVGAGDTAFPHRKGLFTAQYIAPADDRAWLRDTYSAMQPYLGGAAYVNYIDPELSGWERAYYGANYDRLAKVKAAYDPDGVFRFPQAVK